MFISLLLRNQLLMMWESFYRGKISLLLCNLMVYNKSEYVQKLYTVNTILPAKSWRMYEKSHGISCFFHGFDFAFWL